MLVLCGLSVLLKEIPNTNTRKLLFWTMKYPKKSALYNVSGLNLEEEEEEAPS